MTDDERDQHTSDQDLTDLQALDPAHAARPDDGRRPAAQALLARILDERQDTASPVEVERTGEQRRWRRWALAGTAAAAVAAAAIILPAWGTPEPAFATWTPTPNDVPASSWDDVAAQCTTGNAPSDMWQQHAVMVEARGRITFVVARTPTTLRHCLLVDGEFHTSGGGSLQHLPAEVSPTDARAFMATGGGREDDAYQTIIGRVGENVVGVEVHPREPVTEPDVLHTGEFPESLTATIDNGHFSAWWPGAAEELDLTIHLADGTTRSNVPAFAHDR